MAIIQKLKCSKRFRPCPIDKGDELYPNGIFVFNVTKLVAYMDVHSRDFPVESVELKSLYEGDTSHLDEETVKTANLSTPIILAEISPGSFNVIDGNHRVEKARRDGQKTIPARRITSGQHLQFLTTELGYRKYVEYWNEKLKILTQMQK